MNNFEHVPYTKTQIIESFQGIENLLITHNEILSVTVVILLITTSVLALKLFTKVK